MNDWIKHVKMFQAQHNCSYKDALKGASATYHKGCGLISAAKASKGQMYTQGGNLRKAALKKISKLNEMPYMDYLGGNLKKTTKTQLKRIIAILGDKAVGRLSGMGAVGNMLKKQAADTTAQLIEAGGDRASSEMATQGTGVNRLKKAGRWEQFADSTLHDAIDTASKAAKSYNKATMGFGLKRHRKIKGSALMPAGSY